MGKGNTHLTSGWPVCSDALELCYAASDNSYNHRLYFTTESNRNLNPLSLLLPLNANTKLASQRRRKGHVNGAIVSFFGSTILDTSAASGYLVV